MHIAICDDNVADRKQSERLLGRESDARKSVTGVFYTDSYGVGANLFPKRMSYDLFFIDLNEGPQRGHEFAVSLCENGVTAPIVLCSSNPDYLSEQTELAQKYKNILFLNKPILKAELSKILDQAEILEKNQVKTIELRHQNDTLYITEEELVYVRSKGRYLEVFLKDGSTVSILDNILNFYHSLIIFDNIILISEKTIVNASYVTSFHPFGLTINGKIKFPSTLRGYRWLKAIKNKEKSYDNK